jgi:hypothetical protein
MHVVVTCVLGHWLLVGGWLFLVTVWSTSAALSGKEEAIFWVQEQAIKLHGKGMRILASIGSAR